MITRIERDLYFVAGVHFNDAFLINTYDITLSMLVESETPNEHAVAMERLDFFIKNVLTNCVFVNQEHNEVIERYTNAGLEVCALPEEPFDQVVAMAVMLKLNAIMENRISITDITIQSLLSEGIRYPIVLETAENADMFMGPGWWKKNDTSIQNKNVILFEQETNIVKLFTDTEWDQLNLSWVDKPKNNA